MCALTALSLHLLALAVCTVAGATFVSAAAAQDVVTSFASGPPNGVYAFASWNYTPIGACRDYADKIGKAGTPVEFVVLAGAHHKFDSDDTKRYYIRGATRTKAECVLEVDIDTGYAYDRTTGTRLQGKAFTAAQGACRAVGANVEGNHGARDKAAQAAVGFLKKTFAN